MRALASLGWKRSSLLPDVPTVAEQGYPDYGWNNFVGIHAPAGTPRAIVEQLAAAVARSLRDPAVRTKFFGLGLEPVGGTPQEYAALIERETAAWARVLKTVKFKRD